jgi:hypothetical protein
MCLLAIAFYFPLATLKASLLIPVLLNPLSLSHETLHAVVFAN